MRVASRDGLRIRVDDRGRGAPILLLHGFTGSIEAWGEETLEGLARAGHRVIAIDLPGHGRSDIPATPRRAAFPELLRDLTGVLDALEVETADWVGYSMGGRIALAAAVLYPDRVDRLVLESTSPGLDTEAERAERRERDEALADRIVSEGVEAFVEHWMDLPLFDSQRRLSAEKLREARERRSRCEPMGLATCLRGAGTGHQPSFWEKLTDVEHPALLLTGEEDAKFDAIAREMATSLPRARHRSVPGTGHAVHFEAPELWLDEVGSFLGRSARQTR